MVCVFVCAVVVFCLNCGCVGCRVGLRFVVCSLLFVFGVVCFLYIYICLLCVCLFVMLLGNAVCDRFCFACCSFVFVCVCFCCV